MQKFALVLASAAALAAAVPAQAQYNQGQYAQPSGGPLSNLFSCNNPGNRQGSGAAVGAIVGGLAGNQINDNDRTTGTVVGALIGAAAGSMIGCRMQNQDVVRAQQSTQLALNSGRSQSWNNPQTGASGRTDVITTYNYGGGYNPPAYQRPSLNTVRWINGVEQPREYQLSEGAYSASGNTVIRSGPSMRARQLGSLRNGDQVDGLVRVEGTDWVLASRNGQVIGYIQESQTRFLGENYAGQGGYNQGQYGRGQYGQGQYGQGQYAPYQAGRGQMCRVFEQHFTAAGGRTETTRHTACQAQNGEWLVQS